MAKHITKTSEEALFKFDEVIKVKDDQKYLTEILTDRHYEKWFSQVRGGKGKIFILNKGRCGNGGTMGFINYAREHCKGLIVSVPNRSIVVSKEKHDECCCVYGGAESIDKNKNIRICTWDKTDEVEGYDQFGFENIDFFAGSPRFWSGSLLVVDEYHKLIDDSNFRTVCNKIIKTILTTNSNVVLMSATPNYEFIEFLRDFSGKEVETYNVKYDDEDIHKKYIPLQWFERQKGYRMYDIISEVCNTSRKMKKEYELYPSKRGLAHNKVAFFFNSVKEICNIVSQMPDTSDVEVLCAKTELHEATVPCYSKVFNPEKQIHFMTSAYFTGMDIDEKIRFWKVVFIGGNNASYLAYSNKTIKQGLGRFRGGYDGTAFITNGRVKDKFGYIHMKSKISELDEKIQLRKKYAGNQEYVKDHMDEIIQENIDYLYYTTKVESMDGWDDFNSFKKMMSVYPEYTTVYSKMHQPKRYPRLRDISFKVYKQKRLKGIKVAYRYGAICDMFIEKYGLERFANATRSEIEAKLKLGDKVGDVDIMSMPQWHKYDLLLGDGYYRGSYLMSVLDYLGEKCDYEDLEEKMYEVFGCFSFYQEGNTANKRSCLFLCILPKMVENVQILGHASIYNSVSHKLNQNHPLASIKVSKKVSKRNKATQAITDYLDRTKLYSMINDGSEKQKSMMIELFRDTTVISELKKDDGWKQVFDDFKNNQTMISEFYKEVPPSVKYPHKKDEMEKIDCLIVDIDNSISYNEFKEKYGDYTYIAYPTISNADADNWTKFRVIIPLAQTLYIPNDSLNVLKLLRRMVSKYEDKNHQLGSYINQEQWDMKRINKGEVVDISQDTVSYLDALLKNLKTYDGKFKKSKKDGGFSTTNYWDIDRAIAYYQEHDKDGERHRATFVIKNRLSEEDCGLFEDWFWHNHPSKMHHWKSHKRITS